MSARSEPGRAQARRRESGEGVPERIVSKVGLRAKKGGTAKASLSSLCGWRAFTVQ